MFFLGILLSVEALSAAGLLQLLAAELNQAVPDVSIIAAAIGVASAVIDNVSAPCGRGVQDVLVIEHGFELGLLLWAQTQAKVWQLACAQLACVRLSWTLPGAPCKCQPVRC